LDLRRDWNDPEHCESLRKIWVIFNKELLDNLRDRRSIISSLISTLIGPVILVAMVMIVGRSFFTAQDTFSFVLPVSGKENATSLIQFLEQRGVEIVPAPEDAQVAVKNGEVEIVVMIPEDYGQNFTQGFPATIRLVMDSSRQSSISEIERTAVVEWL
jgi:sodium transport system permease protein